MISLLLEKTAWVGWVSINFSLGILVSFFLAPPKKAKKNPPEILLERLMRQSSGFTIRVNLRLSPWCCQGNSWIFFSPEIGDFCLHNEGLYEAKHLLLNKALLGSYLPGVGIGGVPLAHENQKRIYNSYHIFVKRVYLVRATSPICIIFFSK